MDSFKCNDEFRNDLRLVKKQINSANDLLYYVIDEMKNLDDDIKNDLDKIRCHLDISINLLCRIINLSTYKIYQPIIYDTL